MKAIITAALVSFVVAVTCAGASISTPRGGGTPYPIQTRGYQVKLAHLRARMTKLETRENQVEKDLACYRGGALPVTSMAYGADMIFAVPSPTDPVVYLITVNAGCLNAG